LVVTKPRSGAQLAGRCWPGLGGTGAAGQGRGLACAGAALAGVRRGATRAVPVGARRCGPGQGVAGAAARADLAGSARVRCEREKSGRKKGRARVLYPLMFIGPTLQLMTIGGLAYVVAVTPYVRRPPDEHKLRTSVLKPTNIIQNINVGPDEYKKTDEQMPFFCSVLL
jgi:hypothetical protein